MSNEEREQKNIYLLTRENTVLIKLFGENKEK